MDFIRTNRPVLALASLLTRRAAARLKWPTISKTASSLWGDPIWPAKILPIRRCSGARCSSGTRV